MFFAGAKVRKPLWFHPLHYAVSHLGTDPNSLWILDVRDMKEKVVLLLARDESITFGTVVVLDTIIHKSGFRFLLVNSIPSA